MLPERPELAAHLAEGSPCEGQLRQPGRHRAQLVQAPLRQGLPRQQVGAAEAPLLGVLLLQRSQHPGEARLRTASAPSAAARALLCA